MKNAVKYAFPIKESIQSILPIVDEFIVNVGKSEDGTLESIRAIESPKIKIIESEWDPNLKIKGKILAQQTNIALNQCQGDWCFYLQSDEVVHEKDLAKILRCMETHLNDERVEGLLFHWLHFYGDYQHLVRSYHWYQQEIRVIRNRKGIKSWSSAQGFRRDGHKLKVKDTNAYIYHYGWVRPPEAMAEKKRYHDSLHHGNNWEKEYRKKEFDYLAHLDPYMLREFKGTHPEVMRTKVQTWKWGLDLTKSTHKLTFKDIRNRVSDSIARRTGWKIGEYRNYILLKDKREGILSLILYFLYNLLLVAISLLLFPIWGAILVRKQYRQGLWQRLGFFSPELKDKLSGGPRIWFHAASIGEVMASASIITALKQIWPQASLLLTTMTESGQSVARQTVKEASTLTYSPLDFPWSVRRALKLFRPQLYICAETEIWPNLLKIARQLNVKTMLVNGRLSPRAMDRYRKTKFFWKCVLENFDLMSMRSQIDAERIISLGAHPAKVLISGNTKYDKLAEQVNPVFESQIREVLNISKDELVLIAASTRTGEEELMIQVYKKLVQKYPRMLLLIVPRHLDRTNQIRNLLQKNNLEYNLRTELSRGRKRDKPVVVINTIGELFKLYSVGTIVFCGASLVPKGGQNILEPAAWGKVVFYGPSMEDFLDEKELLESVGAGMEIKNVDEFVQKAFWLLDNPAELKRRGEAGRKAVLANQGASRKNAELARRLLQDDGKCSVALYGRQRA